MSPWSTMVPVLISDRWSLADGSWLAGKILYYSNSEKVHESQNQIEICRRQVMPMPRAKSLFFNKANSTKFDSSACKCCRLTLLATFLAIYVAYALGIIANYRIRYCVFFIAWIESMHVIIQNTNIPSPFIPPPLEKQSISQSVWQSTQSILCPE